MNKVKNSSVTKRMFQRSVFSHYVLKKHPVLASGIGVVRAHRAELAGRGAFVCNFDSCGSAAGWNQLITSLDSELSRLVREHFTKNGCYYVDIDQPDPCNDLFPFTVLEIPGITVMRRNCESGVFYHHQPDNTPEILSTAQAAKLAEAALSLIEALADAKLELRRRADPRSRQTVLHLWEDAFGGWRSAAEKEAPHAGT